MISFWATAFARLLTRFSMMAVSTVASRHMWVSLTTIPKRDLVFSLEPLFRHMGVLWIDYLCVSPRSAPDAASLPRPGTSAPAQAPCRVHVSLQFARFMAGQAKSSALYMAALQTDKHMMILVFSRDLLMTKYIGYHQPYILNKVYINKSDIYKCPVNLALVTPTFVRDWQQRCQL